ncbi:ArnT family glycosyltransferase [Solirubrobacter soli]|uniref:ArnT family glycosyltransferase n=1 Tax=Solirubrobacter soli TaxID=363832 RepID=UPI0004112600|nr:glycosyltransferase family 39 protein [Solirubrobacter soli]
MSTLAFDHPRRRRTALARPSLAALTARPELIVLLAIAGVLNLWALDLNGWANDYYAAAVRSMTTSWHAFLYGAFDSAALQTVDKPPLALWIQALSARAFGLNSWSILVPQALMGVATVGLVYDLARSRFGRSAGFVAGLVLALTPITVAISRHNNPDALLVLCVTAAVWALDRGLRQGGSVRWLMLAGAFVGLGFETKMAAALLVVPGMVAAWMWVAPRGRLVASRQLLAGGLVMAAVGLAWPVLVWLTPADSRPYVSGTDDNSIWSLILGYNGLGRLFGQDGGPGGGMGGGGGSTFGGSTGPLRLLNEALGGQAGWFLGFAVVAAVALAVSTRLRRDDARTGWLIAVGGAFAVTAITFSRASGIFHPYYVAALAPFTALLVGGGWSLLTRTAGPFILLGGAVTEAIVIGSSATDLEWARWLIVGATLAAALGLVVARSQRVRRIVATAGVTVLLLAPASWSVQTLGHATSSTFPAGGPQSAQTMGGPGGGRGGIGGGGFGGTPPTGAPGAGGGMLGGDTSSLTSALTYIKANGGGTLVISSQSGAANSIISSGADVAALGGFSGSETTVSIDWLADMVAQGKIRWIIVSSDGNTGMRDGRAGSTAAMNAAAQVGQAVSSVDGLYDLQGTAAALRALA